MKHSNMLKKKRAKIRLRRYTRTFMNLKPCASTRNTHLLIIKQKTMDHNTNSPFLNIQSIFSNRNDKVIKETQQILRKINIDSLQQLNKLHGPDMPCKSIHIENQIYCVLFPVPYCSSFCSCIIVFFKDIFICLYGCL